MKSRTTRVLCGTSSASLRAMTILTSLLMATVAACGAAGDAATDPVPEETEQELLGATTKGNTRYAVEILEPGQDHGCTGHLLNNRWVLGVNHCYPYEKYTPEMLSVRFLPRGESEQTVAVAEIVRHPTNAGFTAVDNKVRQGVDLILFRLAQPVTLNGNSYGIHNPVVPYLPDLTGKLVTCESYGPTENGVDGKLHVRSVTVSLIEWNNYQPDWNGNGSYEQGDRIFTSVEFLSGGDSGGSCYYTLNGTQFLVAKIAGGKNMLLGTGRSADRMWIDRTQFSRYTAVPGMTTEFAPAILDKGPNQIEIFATSVSNSQIYRSVREASGKYGLWSRVSDGLFLSGPAAGYVGSTTMVVGRGTDNQYYYTTATGNNFSGFNAISNGTFASAPAVAVTPNGTTLVAFGLGLDNQIWYRKYTNGAWQGNGWTPIANGLFGSAPSAVFTTDSKVYVVGRGTDNAYWFATGTLGATDSFTAWTSLGGIYASAPTVASWGGTRVDVFGRGIDNALYHSFTDNATDWAASKLEHASFGEGAAATADAVGSIHLAATGTDRKILTGRYPE